MIHRLVSLVTSVGIALSMILSVSSILAEDSSRAPGSPQTSRPNILFIIADDLNNSLGCYGHPLAKTPNIDRLAQQSVRFDKAYCTFPLCGPSRNSILTGLYPNSTGILQNSQIFRQSIPQHSSLPEQFRKAGYFSARIGKLYHYNVPTSIGTDGHDDPASWELKINPAGIDHLQEETRIHTLTPRQFGGTLSWYASPGQDLEHTDGKVATEAELLLTRFAQHPEQPFFLAVGFYRPHTPFVAPAEPYFGWYDRSEMPLIPGIEEDQLDIPKPALASAKKEQDQLTDPVRQEVLQAYFASISFMDAQVGRVLASLKENGLVDNTIVVFTSDHGYHLGEHGLWQKQSLFEESARVPLLISAPGVSRAGHVISEPVSQVDLYPTLVKLAKIPAPASLQGQSLVSLLSDPQAKGRGWALTQVMRNQGNPNRAGAAAKKGTAASVPQPQPNSNRFFGYSLRTDQFRYTEWDDGQRGRELYNHLVDPKELNNLAEKPEYAAKITELSALLKEAVGKSLPPGGVTPEVSDKDWPPVLAPLRD
ncbi:Choline-sulfatase [Planctopirus ephydatiae]|uniref:Choline-sulfatase n=1 Tax=Planctopirus ephydatiae TaxID=2528019 RepID=A0A518GLN5_9PLAN|nr:sulfatase [Planctopirus ephydatiae]QDV29530.1 Choline-sulfatase [Planctopirus ephydatiae]